MAIQVRLIVFACLCALPACDEYGSGESSTSSSSSGNASTNAPQPEGVFPGGIWEGLDPVTMEPLIGLILADGEFSFYRQDGTQYVGVATTTSSGQIGSTFGVYAEYGYTFTDGATSGKGTLTGTITPYDSMLITISVTDANGTSSGQPQTLDFQGLFNQPVSVGALAGSYSLYSHPGVVLTVTSDGTVSATKDPSTGCVFNGTISQVNSSYNGYDMSGVFTGCTGVSTAFNGVPLSGLAMARIATSPYELMAMLTGDIGGSTAAVTYIACGNMGSCVNPLIF